MNPCTLVPADGKKKFDDFLKQPTVILLLIFGEDSSAVIGQKYCNDLLSQSPGQFPDVQFIFVPDYNLILTSLQALSINIQETDSKPFVWNQYTDTAALSISPKSNIISYLLTKDDLSNSTGDIIIALNEASNND
ncbi:MAG TPA: hypothetical protein VK705_07665 [Ferruginibacter sp.]|jgi:hypothetical protein|nr:hypothetical protein [Ferruginibacter sp.]